MSKKAFERKLAELDALKADGTSPATGQRLVKALRERNNYLVGKAADITAALGLGSLIPDLAAAFERFFGDPVKSDPQCWAKIALAKALSSLGFDDPEVFQRGLKHIQMEPVWGGQADTAGPLRAACLLALTQCRNVSTLDILGAVVEALADPEKAVRVEGARVVGHLGCAEGALLARLKCLTGDDEPEVLGACYSALLAVEGRMALPFVSRFLERTAPAREEAAIALGETRDPEAFRILHERWQSGHDASFTGALLFAMGLTGQPEAIDLLIRHVEENNADSEVAVEALSAARVDDETRVRIRQAVAETGSPRLEAAFGRYFGG